MFFEYSNQNKYKLITNFIDFVNQKIQHISKIKNKSDINEEYNDEEYNNESELNKNDLNDIEEIILNEEISNEEIIINEEVINNEKIKTKNLTKFIGKTISKTDKCKLFEISISKLINYINQKIIIIPEFQRILDENKVNKMYNDYKKDNTLFNFITNPLQFVILKSNDYNIEQYFLIDGQHRLSMFQKIYKEGINNNIRCNIIICNNTEEMYNIYNKLNINNKDIYDNCEITNIINYNKYILLRNHFETNYKNHFINNTTNEHIYHIEEYVRKLKDNKFLQNFNHLNEAIEYHDHVNKIYLKYYTNISIYTEIERKRLNSSIVFTLKKNNFLDYLLTPEKKCLSFQHLHKKTL
jgi:hypothetical protein